jgi:hypothetical protein
MAVNHRWTVARLLCGQIFVGVQRKMKGAKGVAQSVPAYRDSQLVPQLAEQIMEVVQRVCPN